VKDSNKSLTYYFVHTNKEGELLSHDLHLEDITNRNTVGNDEFVIARCGRMFRRKEVKQVTKKEIKELRKKGLRDCIGCKLEPEQIKLEVNPH